MDRFVSKRSSSSLNLDSASLDDVRAERAAFALSVGLSWPRDRYTKTRGRPSWQQLWERALQEHILNHHELPHGVRLQRPPGGTVAFSMDHGPLDMLVQIVHAGKTDAVLPEHPWPERTHHVTSENGWATTTTILQLAASLDDVMKIVDPPLGHGEHPCQRGHPGRHAGRFPSHRARIPPATKHVVQGALRRGRLPRSLGHEQSMAAPVFGRMGSSRSHGPLRRE